LKDSLISWSGSGESYTSSLPHLLEAQTSAKADASEEAVSSWKAKGAVLASMEYARRQLHRRWAGEDPADAELKITGVNH
jgi:hypothetical protein